MRPGRPRPRGICLVPRCTGRAGTSRRDVSVAPDLEKGAYRGGTPLTQRILTKDTAQVASASVSPHRGAHYKELSAFIRTSRAVFKSPAPRR